MPIPHPSEERFELPQLPGLAALWAETLGDPRIGIALLDGPVDGAHPCLKGARLTPMGASGETPGHGIAERHGTQIASLIFGQHDSDIHGTAPGCPGFIFPIFRDKDDGSFMPSSQIQLAQTLVQAAEAGARIINISAGENSPSGTAHPILTEAVQSCADQGVLIVAAAGNEGCDCLHIPGALPSVLAVGAMDASGTPLACSNWGDTYRTQGILAPGQNIVCASPGGGTSTASGTSYATAIVSGVVALLASLQAKAGRPIDLFAVRKAILDSALGCDASQATSDCRRLLAGRLNITGAHALILQGLSDMTLPQNTEDQPQTAVTANVSPTGRTPESPTETERVMAGAQPMTQPPGHTMPTGAYPSTQATETTLMPTNQACACTGNGSKQPVFALGKLNYDFGTEARRDSIQQHMDSASPHDAKHLLNYLDNNPWDAESVIWTLNMDLTPIYAIKGYGAYAHVVYERLRAFLAIQIENRCERISIPGYIVGSTALFNGQVVPTLQADLRGMYSWNTHELIHSAHSDTESSDAINEDVSNFFVCVYEELRNLGVSAHDRAINYAATNALTVLHIFEDTLKRNLVLDTISTERSPICRPQSDCWDVKLTFFNPSKIFEQARKVYLLTVDVSDVVPVMVGQVRSWSVYGHP